ncbi:hypothetical protein LOCC1_G006358 [Lachnellula occidentalis]|uniref:N-acetyltransferase domain-containing protein n=1 Tax=Lachnellula occidentalis TaxID=215460 RepID=A0A8H8RUN0_9HELO|nr:hypothetical protein LOCC1_G006358 [Lachnellula occidentalis]
MSPPEVEIILATEQDAPHLAALTTTSFAASDAAYPLIWGSAPAGTHDAVSLAGLFSPVQKADRVTLKAVHANGKLVGLATWNMPSETVSTGGAGLPDIEGVEMGLWNEKALCFRGCYERDVDVLNDMSLSLFFVHPEYQRQGIGSLLLEWGMKKADEMKARIWIASTPQAVSTYERNGWKVVERYDVMLEKYGGRGVYSRAWMLRELPAAA